MCLFMLPKIMSTFQDLSTFIAFVNLCGMTVSPMDHKVVSSQEGFPTVVTPIVEELFGPVVGSVAVIHVHVNEAIVIMLKATVLDKKARAFERFIAMPAFINVDAFGTRNPGLDINQTRVDNSWWRGDGCGASIPFSHPRLIAHRCIDLPEGTH